MRTVRLYWKTRLTKKRKAEVKRGLKKIYREVKEEPGCLRILATNRDTKFLWVFMFSKAFRDLQ